VPRSEASDESAAATPAPARTRVAFVLWSGHLGGAQALTAELAGALRRDHDIDARIVFVCGSDLLARRLHELNVPYEALGLPRGRHVVRHPHALAKLVQSQGPDCAVLVSSGYLAGSLHVGGYRGPIAAVEHGSLLQVDQLSGGRRLLRQVDRLSGVWACDVEVAVSNYTLEALMHQRHAKQVICIQNGVDLRRFAPAGDLSSGSRFTLGYAGRLVASKGVADVIRAFAAMKIPQESLLLIAGDGPERQALEVLGHRLDVGSKIRFLGRIDDVPQFWRMCDVGVAPSAGWVESFCLGAVEAMACGLPVVASKVGALPEVIDDGASGFLVDLGNIKQLTHAFERYARDVSLRHQHGLAARLLCEQRYDFAETVRGYRDLVAGLVEWRAHGRRLVLPLRGARET
jgi:glycosyltransferase involved in cell wall biosynthesis